MMEKMKNQLFSVLTKEMDNASFRTIYDPTVLKKQFEFKNTAKCRGSLTFVNESIFELAYLKDLLTIYGEKAIVDFGEMFGEIMQLSIQNMRATGKINELVMFIIKLINKNLKTPEVIRLLTIICVRSNKVDYREIALVLVEYLKGQEVNLDYLNWIVLEKADLLYGC